MAAASNIAQVRRPRTIAWAAVVPIAAVVAVILGTVAWGAAQPGAPTPSATPSGTATAATPDGRFPLAPELTADLWDRVDASWDLEVADYPGGGTSARPRGDLAAYVTPPGGERYLAYFEHGVLPADLRGFAWDPEARQLLLASGEAQEFAVIDLRSGTRSQVTPPGVGANVLWDVTTLGRGSDGRTYLAIETFPEGRDAATLVVGWDGDGWGPVRGGDYRGASPLSGDLVVMTRPGVVATLDVVTGVESAPFGEASDCEFRTWATTVDFTVRCAADLENEFGVIMSGSTATRDAFAELATATYAPFPWGSPAQIVVGTPIVFNQATSVNSQVREVGVATTAGYRSAGAAAVDLFNAETWLAADTRWFIAEDDGIPVIVDAARATLVDLRTAFAGTPTSFAFIPGTR